MHFSFTDYGLYQSHCQRCEAALEEFHQGKMSADELTDYLLRMGWKPGEIRTEIEMREGHV